MTPTERALLMAIADFLLSANLIRDYRLEAALKALEEEDQAAAKARLEQFRNSLDTP